MAVYDKKAELEGTIKALEEEKTALLEEIPKLKEKVAVLRLEDRARTLEGEVAALRSQKATVEEEIAEYSHVYEHDQPQPLS